MLLAQREAAAAAPAPGVFPVPGRRVVLLAATLLGFGLFGLLAEGWGLAEGPWAAAWAAAGAVLFAGASHLLRPRALAQASGPAS
jgi:hypothetical protein